MDGAWVFQANPNIYDLKAALNAGQRTFRWSVNQHKEHIHTDDRVYLWLSGSDGGLLAQGVILSEPTMMDDGEEIQFYMSPPEDSLSLRVELRIDTVLATPIQRAELHEELLLQSMSLLRAPQGTNFQLQEIEASIIEQLVRGIPSFQQIVEQYHRNGTVFRSVTRGTRYAIQEVDDAGCLIARLDANQPHRLTFSQYENKAQMIRDQGGQFPRMNIDGTAAVRTTVRQGAPWGLSVDKAHIVDLSDEAAALGNFCEHLKALNVDQSKGNPKLYKPAMLACVVEGVDRGELVENRVEFDWLLPKYQEKMRELGQEAGLQQAVLPFYHLTSELFWMLSYHDITQLLDGDHLTATAVRERVRFASIKETYWRLLLRHRHRQAILNVLRETWWPYITENSSDPIIARDVSMIDNVDKLRTAFKEYQQSPIEQLRVAIRRKRAEQIRSLLSQPDHVDYEQFNQEVWVNEYETRFRSESLKKRIFEDGALSTSEVQDLKEALEQDEIELHGNYTWSTVGHVFGGQLKTDEEVKMANIRQALAVLNGQSKNLVEKATQIQEVPGFGPSITTGMVMLYHPNDFAIYNQTSRSVLGKLGLPIENLEVFQNSMRQLKDALYAADFIELDWFLCEVDQGRWQFLDTPVERRAFSGRYWAIGLGEGGRMWGECQQDGVIAIGWDYLEDYSQYKTKEEFTDAISQYRENQVRPINDAMACFQFTHEIAVGDIVFAKQGLSKLFGIGLVESDYQYNPERSEYHSVRQVRWIKEGPWDIPEGARLPTKTLTDVSNYQAFLDFALALFEETDIEKKRDPIVPRRPVYTVDDALSGLFMTKEEFTSILEALGRKKNVILQGPPGVGKTFVARKLAYAMIGYKAPEQVEMVQFHQSYSYEDFIQGWRPNPNGGFVLKNGVFYTFCQKARADSGTNYVFIIDEINRGNLSKIFGELLMLLEADKREPDYAMPLTYSQENEDRFHIPSNVYVVGMMNTADRSLAMVDYALRRRFTFIDLKPQFESGQFNSFLEGTVESEVVSIIIERITQLNQEIRQDKVNLGPGFEIGHSFFCPQGTEEGLGYPWYESVIRAEIAPLIREYWFDDAEKAQKIVDQLLQ